MVKIKIADYDEGIDVFTVSAFGFTPEDEAADADYYRSAPDFDDFDVPGICLPALIGEYGEPSDLVGQVFEVKLPA
jgi:hypothetical protein